MTTWAVVRDHVRSIAQDDVAPYDISDDSMLIYANYALTWLATRHGGRSSATVEMTDGAASLPSDFERLLAVYDMDGEELAESLFDSPPRGYYSLIGETLYAEETKLFLVYTTGYPQLVDGTDEIPAGKSLTEAFAHYVTSMTLYQKAVDTGDLRRWNTKTDSGIPEHNPYLTLADKYMGLAERAASR